jgi:hypothetical protein
VVYLRGSLTCSLTRTRLRSLRCCERSPKRSHAPSTCRSMRTTQRPSRNGPKITLNTSGVGPMQSIVAWMDYKHSEQFGVVNKELREGTHFGAVAWATSFRLDDMTLNWRSSPHWKGRPPVQTLYGWTIELAAAMEVTGTCKVHGLTFEKGDDLPHQDRQAE